MGAARERGETRMEADTPTCIMMDSRIDRKTILMHYDEEPEKFFPRVKAARKPSEVVARTLFDWLKTHGVDETLTHFEADSTMSNTGWSKGTIAWLEKLSGKKLHWLSGSSACCIPTSLG